MNKHMFAAVLLIGMVTVTTAAEQSSPALTAVAGFTYDTNTFVIYNDCLGIYPGTSLQIQEEIWSFAPPARGG